jgi:hypothetical protein
MPGHCPFARGIGADMVCDEHGGDKHAQVIRLVGLLTCDQSLLSSPAARQPCRQERLVAHTGIAHQPVQTPHLPLSPLTCSGTLSASSRTFRQNAASPAAPSSPNPQLNQHRAVVGECFPHRFVGLPIGEVAEGGAIDSRQRPAVNDNMINKFCERVVPATHRHVLGQRGEIGIGGLTII